MFLYRFIQFSFVHWLIGILLIFLFTNCTDPLERQNVPIWGGSVFNKSCSQQILIENIQYFKEFGLSGWMVEIPFYVTQSSHTSDFRYYESSLLDTLLPVLEKTKIDYGLYFSLNNPDKLSTRKVNISDYFTDISGILLKAKTNLPIYIGFGEGFLASDLTEMALPNYIDQIKKEIPDFKGKFVYGTFPNQLTKKFDFQTPDIIGIIFPPPIDEAFKRRYKNSHIRISSLLLKHDKPAMILQSNLLNTNKYIQLKNELRFWDEDVTLTGLVLNSENCYYPFSDNSGLFNLGKDRLLLNYLDSYIRLDSL